MTFSFCSAKASQVERTLSLAERRSICSERPWLVFANRCGYVYLHIDRASLINGAIRGKKHLFTDLELTNSSATQRSPFCQTKMLKNGSGRCHYEQPF